MSNTISEEDLAKHLDSGGGIEIWEEDGVPVSIVDIEGEQLQVESIREVHLIVNNRGESQFKLRYLYKEGDILLWKEVIVEQTSYI